MNSKTFSTEFSKSFSYIYLLKSLMLIIIITLADNFSVNAQKMEWGIKLPTYFTPFTGERKLEVDSEGNVVAIFPFYNESFEIQGHKFERIKGKSAMGIAKFNPSGKLLWAKVLYSNLYVYDFVSRFPATYSLIDGFAIDKDNNIIISGKVNDSISIDNIKLKGPKYLYLIKIKPDGLINWAKQYFCDSHIATGPIVCKNNAYYFSGQFKGNLTFDSFVLSDNRPGGTAVSSSFICKVSSNGEVINAQNVCTGTLLGLDVDQLHNIYIVGHIRATSTVGDIVLTPKNSSYTMFYAKADSNFKFKFANTIQGGQEYNGLKDVKADSSGSFYVTGMYDGKPLSYTYFTSAEIYLGKYDQNGNELWTKRITHKGEWLDRNEGAALTLDKYGDLYLAAQVKPSLSKYSPSGKLLWQDTSTAISEDVAINSFGKGFIISQGFNTRVIGNDSFIGQYIASFRAFHSDTSNKLRGKIFYDKNKNCKFDDGDAPLSNYVIKGMPGEYYAMSDEEGNYTLHLDTGTFTIQQIPPTNSTEYSRNSCPTTGQYTFKAEKYGQDTTGFDFANDIIPCSNLEITVSAARRRRCATSHTTVKYANTGIITANNVKVIVEYPKNTVPISSVPAWTSNTNGILTYDIPTLAGESSNTIVILDSIKCAPCIAGSTECIKATITPRLFCSDPTSWDKSFVNVDGKCSNAQIRFVISNIGQGGMSDSSDYRIFEDNKLVYQANFKLMASDSLVQVIPANGKTFRLEADQINYPEASSPSVSVEACGIATYCQPFSKGQILAKGFDDDKQISYSCGQIVDSYDPNDKEVTPSGILSEKYVESGKLLTYVINFQNTGTDTAYKVVIQDTLDFSLDPAGITEITGSHPFKYTMTGKGLPVLNFTFDNINLPDSTKNQRESNGFVRFKIGLKKDITQGTAVRNKAYIYFDYNDPVITNEVSVTIYDTVEVAEKPLVLSNRVKRQVLSESKFYPNPLKDEATFHIDNPGNEILTLSIADIGGNVVFKDKLFGNSYLYQNHLNPGMYIYKVESENGIKSIGKILITK